MKIEQIRIEQPKFERLHESVVKIFDSETYLARIANALELAKEKGLSHLAIYGDREHFANIHYFTGYDPRFEEALLILSPDRKPLLLAGNEGVAYARIIPYELDTLLFHSFSLPGQPRDMHTKEILNEAFLSAGIGDGSRIGLIGWKYFSVDESQNPDSMFDIPHYIVEKLSNCVGSDMIENATAFMIDPIRGLRTTLDVNELTVLELAGTKSSRGVYNLLTHLEPGISEIEASSYLEIDGDPLIAHPNVNFTEEGIRQGLVSPGGHVLKLNSVCNVGFGYRSSMVARTGIYAHDRPNLDKEYNQFWEEVLIPYFRVMVCWYESLRIGVSGKAVVERLKREVPEFDSLGIGLNPGHLIHNDEWTTSVFTETDDFILRSGMAIQCDIIAVPTEFPGMHVEDGLALADSNLREKFKHENPVAWGRIQRRRKFMREILGIDIGEELLPFSDIQGCLFPFMADLGVVMAVVEH